MACKATGMHYCIWVKYNKDGHIKGWWRCFDCLRRRRARR